MKEKLAKRRKKSPLNTGNNMRSSLSERNDQAYIEDSEKINLSEAEVIGGGDGKWPHSGLESQLLAKGRDLVPRPHPSIYLTL